MKWPPSPANREPSSSSSSRYQLAGVEPARVDEVADGERSARARRRPRCRSREERREAPVEPDHAAGRCPSPDDGRARCVELLGRSARAASRRTRSCRARGRRARQRRVRVVPGDDERRRRALSSSRTASTSVETVPKPNFAERCTPTATVVVATETSSTLGVRPGGAAAASTSRSCRRRRSRPRSSPVAGRRRDAAGRDARWRPLLDGAGRGAGRSSRGAVLEAGSRRRGASRRRAGRRRRARPRPGELPETSRSTSTEPSRRAGRGSRRGCAARSTGRTRPGSRCRRARSGRRTAPARRTGRSGRRAPCRSRRSTAGRAGSCRCRRPAARSRASRAAISTRVVRVAAGGDAARGRRRGRRSLGDHSLDLRRCRRRRGRRTRARPAFSATRQRASTTGSKPTTCTPDGDEQPDGELADEAEPDDARRLPERDLGPADALHRDGADGRERGVLRAARPVGDRHAEVRRHPVDLGVQRVLVARGTRRAGRRRTRRRPRRPRRRRRTASSRAGCSCRGGCIACL